MAVEVAAGAAIDLARFGAGRVSHRVVVKRFRVSTEPLQWVREEARRRGLAVRSEFYYAEGTSELNEMNAPG
jgi:hypothetical protein